MSNAKQHKVDSSPDEHATLVSLARHYAKAQGEKPYISWLIKGKTESETYTYAELDIRARALAVQLTQTYESNFKTSDDSTPPAAVITTQPGLEFVIAFFACLYAGIVAVPAYPLKQNESTKRLQALLKDSGAKLLITDNACFSTIKNCQRIAASARIIFTSDVKPQFCALWSPPEINANSVAFYQYTSGSTGEPKGVVITHGNLMNNEKMIAKTMKLDSRMIVVGWLPLYHDMGLIGNLLHSFYLGARCVLMSPLSFVTNPICWLEAISHYRATVSGGPNFAYELCLRRTTVKQRESLDLSSWKVAFNGAEPIRAETLQRFSKEFSKYGLSQSAFHPCYGMAESTLIIAGKKKNKIPSIISVEKNSLSNNIISVVTDIVTENNDDWATKHDENHIEDSTKLVSSGMACEDCEVIIVNPVTKTKLSENQVGEIWVRSDSIAKKYKNKSLLSRLTFQATLAGGESNKQFLRTGDLGFLHNNELFITGRSKDLIILNGKNHYPQDIELTVVNAYPGLNNCTAAAFSIDLNGIERLIVILSIKKNIFNTIEINEVTRSVKFSITRQHAVPLYDLVITTTRLPLTSSGKIQRSKSRKLYQQSAFERLTFVDEKPFATANLRKMEES